MDVVDGVVPRPHPDHWPYVDPDSMRAGVLLGPCVAAVRTVDRPIPGPGEVRIRVDGCAIADSDRLCWEGLPWARYPRDPGAPGHEGWGRVDEVGHGVTSLRPGQRVAFLGERSFAEYDVAAADRVVRLPRSLDGRPFPGAALAAAVDVVARSRILPGMDVAVVGAGFMGALLTRLAARAGGNVIALSRRDAGLRLARAMGALATVAVHETEQVLRDLRGLTGHHHGGPRQVNMALWNWKGLDVVNAHERNPHVRVDRLREAVHLAACGELDAQPLFTHALPLDALQEGLELARTRPAGFVKALVLP
jgi:threonine dehydrogenase-like Zn-dependent dehydrogenase